jgi:UDP-glucose 4-epimerase
VDVDVAGQSVLVTGGAGFIGSHLVRALVARGARRVVALDSLRYGDPANMGAGGSGVGDQRVELVRHTLGSDPPAALAAPMAGVDVVFHLAAEKHNQSKDDPSRVLRANVEGTYAVLDAAAAAGVQKVVFTSSLYAYGRIAGPPFVETEVPRPTTIYGISKLAGEHLCAHVGLTRGLRWTVLRYLFVYGPRQFAGMGYKSVIVKNAERVLAGTPPVIHGDGAQSLDYVFVDDVIDATIAALAPEADGEVLNVGSGRATTVAELVAALQRAAGTSFAPLHDPPDWTTGSVRVGDVGKVRRVLGWRPRTGLEEGLERTVAWLRERGGPPRPTTR